MVTEGFEYVSNRGRGIKYSDDETLVDTNDKTNPTLSTITIMYPHDTEVWSIFLRKDVSKDGIVDGSDGNPLLHAFKNEFGWHFETEDDRDAFTEKIDNILKNFLSIYSLDVTIVIPSTNALNMFIADRIKKLRPKATIITDLLRKMSAEEVKKDIHNPDSEFAKKIKNTGIPLRAAYKDVDLAVREMDRLYDGLFVYHLINNDSIRNAITDVLTYNGNPNKVDINKIKSHDVLVIDDSMSRGHTIINACNLIKEFGPKKMTVLTLFSPKATKNSLKNDHKSWLVYSKRKMNESEIAFGVKYEIIGYVDKEGKII